MCLVMESFVGAQDNHGLRLIMDSILGAQDNLGMSYYGINCRGPGQSWQMCLIMESIVGAQDNRGIHCYILVL